MRREIDERMAALEAMARRVLSDVRWKPDPALVAEGWERRFIVDRQRAGEIMELYRQLGYDVRAEPVRPSELEDECEQCQLIATLQFVTIYTRKRSRAE